MKKRFCIITAVLAAFFMFPIFGFAAYAAPIYMTTANMTENDIVEENTPEPNEPTDTEDESGAELPALPPGTATVIDYNTDPDGRLFYTVMTPDEHVFYLIIDKNSNTDNVYFLNVVTIADLAALAEMPAQTSNISTATPSTPTSNNAEQPSTEPQLPADKPKSGGNIGMYIIIGLLVIVGGGAGWYFKIYRPKQQGTGDINEYDPSVNDSENDFSDDWGENISLYGGEADIIDGTDESENPDNSDEYDPSADDSENEADSDDTPPWYEDVESGDEE